MNSVSGHQPPPHALQGDHPFMRADWERVVFLHFSVPGEVLRCAVPSEFELEAWHGESFVSLVALTMSRFRPSHWCSPAWCFAVNPRQRFLNLRTYVRRGDESGALFLWGWLSSPWRFATPAQPFGLNCGFASIHYDHAQASGQMRGTVATRSDGQFAYRAARSPVASQVACAPGSLEEFTLERCTGFFRHRDRTRIFRVWHPPWLQTAVELTLEDRRLVENQFPWFRHAAFVSAHYATGFPRVGLGAPHRAPDFNRPVSGHRVLSRLFEMP